MENIRKWLKHTQNIRKIENSGIALDIRDSEVSIALIKNNTLLLIKDQAFAKLMKNLFEKYYEQAESVK